MTWAAPSQVLRLKTHCARGHELTPDNVFRKDDGWRRCRECRRQDALRWYHRNKAAAA